MIHQFAAFIGYTVMVCGGLAAVLWASMAALDYGLRKSGLWLEFVKWAAERIRKRAAQQQTEEK